MIFGMGKLYKEKENYIRKHFHVVGFLDNGVPNDSQTLEEGETFPVYHPQNIRQHMKESVKIILMSYEYVAMWRQLYELGIGQERVLFGFMFPPLKEDGYILFDEGRHLEIEGRNIVYNISRDSRIVIEKHKQLQKIGKRLLREKYRKEYPIISAVAQMDIHPVSRKFGLERGSAIDRFYIENFLEENKELICGDCLEIAENTYTLRYGENRVDDSYILHVKGWGENAIKGDLATGEGIEADRYDCAIITQTMMFIFDIKSVAENIYKMLKKGGNALITVSGISQISRHDANLWGSFYSFHEDAMKELFEPLFGKDNVKVHTYGNAKVAMAMLCGLCREDLSEEDFITRDADYPVIISVVLTKN